MSSACGDGDDEVNAGGGGGGGGADAVKRFSFAEIRVRKNYAEKHPPREMTTQFPWHGFLTRVGFARIGEVFNTG